MHLQIKHLLALWLLILPQLAQAADEPRQPLLVVLEFKVENKAIDLDLAQSMANLVRSRMVRGMRGQVKLISKEKVFEILKSSSKKAEQCTSDCEVQTAREIGAEYAVTGHISKFNDKVLIVLEVKRSRDGVAVASVDKQVAPNKLDSEMPRLCDALSADLLLALDGKPHDSVSAVIVPSPSASVATDAPAASTGDLSAPARSAASERNDSRAWYRSVAGITCGVLSLTSFGIGIGYASNFSFANVSSQSAKDKIQTGRTIAVVGFGAGVLLGSLSAVFFWLQTHGPMSEAGAYPTSSKIAISSSATDDDLHLAKASTPKPHLHLIGVPGGMGLSLAF